MEAANIHLILLRNRLNDFPKIIKDNIPARLEFNKFGESEAVFSFKEKLKFSFEVIDSLQIIKYLTDIMTV